MTGPVTAVSGVPRRDSGFTTPEQQLSTRSPAPRRSQRAETSIHTGSDSEAEHPTPLCTAILQHSTAWTPSS